MSYSRLLTAVVFSLAVLFYSDSVQADDSTQSREAVDTNHLHSKLLGAWAFAGKPDSTEAPKPNATLKFFGHSNYVIVRSDPKTGEVINCHGGTYSLDRDTYTGTVKFGTERRKSMIGRTFKFKIKIDGDVFIQEGIGNNFNERWIRQESE